MESNETFERLIELGFTPLQIERLHRIRCIYAEREQKEMTTERRRLEFARWLVSTGRLTDEIVEVAAF